MVEIRGRFNPVKNRLMQLISLAHPALQPNLNEEHVSGDWVTSFTKYRTLPYITVRVSPIDIEDPVYGRVFEGGLSIKYGSIADFDFTAHIHTSACNTTGEDTGKHAQDLADSVVNYLTAQKDSQSTYGIEDIYDMTMRESDMGDQPIKIARVILRGRLLTKRYDA